MELFGNKQKQNLQSKDFYTITKNYQVQQGTQKEILSPVKLKYFFIIDKWIVQQIKTCTTFFMIECTN